MLELELVTSELYDEDSTEFKTESYTLYLEHSLVSLSKWESKWEKPFLTQQQKSKEETVSYIDCMILNDEVPKDYLSHIEDRHIVEIQKYIGAKMTATWFAEQKKSRNQEVITSELIYYWMFTLTIPKECEEWHLNRLLTLIRVFSEKNSPDKKMSRTEALARQRRINAERKARLGTTG